MRMKGDETSPAVYSMRMEDTERALRRRPGSGATRAVFLCHIFIRDLRSEIRAGDGRVQTERMEPRSQNLRSLITFFSFWYGLNYRVAGKDSGPRDKGSGWQSGFVFPPGRSTMPMGTVTS